MDVTGLSLTIDIDMTVFFEAMERLTAVILVAADEIEAMEGSFNKASEGIKKVGDTTEDTIALIEDAIDLVKDILEIAAGDEEAWVTLLLDLGKTTIDVKKTIDDSTESTNQQTESIKKQSTEVDHLAELHKKLAEAKKDSTAGEKGLNKPMPIGDGGTFNLSLPEHYPVLSDSTSAQNSSPGDDLDNINAHRTPHVSDITHVATPPPPSESSIVGPVQTEDSNQKLEEDFQKKLELIQQFMGKIDGHIKIKAVAEAESGLSAQTQTIINQQNNYVQQINNTTTALGKETVAHKTAADSAKEHADAMQALGQLGVHAVEGLAEGLGQMAAGKKVDMGAIMMKMLGDAIKQYGEKLVGLGAAMIGFGDPMGTLKMGEGAALIAIGAGMSAVKMAAGGIVSGSSFVNVGEYAGASHNPEVIAPLDKLRNMMGGGGNQTHEFRISGDSLVSVLSRVDNNNQFALGQ